MGVIVEACWKGYRQAGLKKKGDRMVPNCVPISEDINIPINVGDTLLGGKFKNKRIVVKSIDKNEKGDITINGKPLLKFRMIQEGGDVIGICEMGCGPRRKGESDADYKRRCGGRYTYAFPLYMTSKAEEPKEEPTTPPSDSEPPAETPPGGIGEANAVSGSKIHKFITGKNLTLKGKKYPDIEFEVVSTDNKSELVKLRVLSPKNLFGQELKVPFKTIRRGPFIKTQTGGVIEASKARNEDWNAKYKRSIDCNNPRGFSQKAHCQGRKKNESLNEIAITPILIKGLIGIITTVGVGLIRAFAFIMVSRVINGAILTYHDIKNIVAPEPYIKFLKGLNKNDKFNKEFIELILSQRKPGAKVLLGSAWENAMTSLPSFVESFDRFTNGENISEDDKELLLARIQRSMRSSYMSGWRDIHKTLKKKYPDLAKDLREEIKNKSILENSLSDLEKKLKSHDWWYAYSDDNRKYTSGQINWFEIIKMIKGMKGNKEAEKLWNKYVPKDFNYSFKSISEQTNEDLRKWFGKGKTGSSGGGGWDRYGSDGQKLGKCGDGDEGDAYAACLSKEKAAKLGPKGRAAFVRRKRADQKKAGDSKKGGEQSKGQKPTFSKTGA